MATTLTSLIIEVDIPRLKRSIESIPDVRVVSITPPQGVNPTTVVCTKGDKVSDLSPAQEIDVQAAIDGHVDQLDQSAKVLSRVKAVLGTIETGTIDFENNGLAWQINENKHLVPATGSQHIGSVTNPVGVLYVTNIIGGGGGGGGNNSVWNEIPVGDKDGVNTDFTTSLDFLANSTRLFYNGLKLRRGASFDYVEVGLDTISLNFAPESDDELIVEYDLDS